MEITQLSQELIDKFKKYQLIGYKNLESKDRKEYQQIKGLIMKHQPELLEPKEEVPTNTEPPKEEIRKDDIVLDRPKVVKQKDNGLNDAQQKLLMELNNKFPTLDAEERRERELLRNKVRNYKMEQARKIMGGSDIKLGDTLEEVVWILSVMSQGLAPQLFKSVSAAGLDEAEIKLMHIKAKKLNEKING